MTIQYRANSTAGGNTTSVAIAKPAGTLEDDLLVAHAFSDAGGTISAPPGWALLRDDVGPSGFNRVAFFTKTAGASEPSSYTFTFASGESLVLMWVAYDDNPAASAPRVNASSLDVYETSSTLIDAPSVTTTDAGMLFGSYTALNNSVSQMSAPSGMTYQTTYRPLNTTMLGLFRQTLSAGSTGTKIASVVNSSQTRSGGLVAVTPGNVPPNAPILTGPLSTTLNPGVINRFTWSFSDPDSGDSQSKYDLRYRVVGAASWTVVTGTTPNSFRDMVAGMFVTSSDYEWQVRTYDAVGEVGPYSASGFFSTADPPPQPTITDPINGQTIPTDSYTGAISAPSVDESEWRLVADNAGVIDEATVLHGPVLKTTGDLRSHTFTGLTNGVTVWWQARTKFGGLWSQWAAVRTPVAYTPPPAPTVTPAASDADGAVSVTHSTPTPGAGEPTVTHVDLYVRDTTGTDTYRPTEGIRWAMFRVPNGVTVDWLAASGINYEYQAVAHGDNGTTAASAWTPIDPNVVPNIYYGGGYGD